MTKKKPNKSKLQFLFIYQIDLAQIKQRYQQVYNRSLAQDVGGDTSGDYKRILLSIIK